MLRKLNYGAAREGQKRRKAKDKSVGKVEEEKSVGKRDGHQPALLGFGWSHRLGWSRRLGRGSADRVGSVGKGDRGKASLATNRRKQKVKYRKSRHHN